MNDLAIETFPIGSFACNCSIIYDRATKDAIIIDPGNDAPKLLSKVESLGVKVKYLLHTHAHFDHIGQSKNIKDALGCPIHLHKDDMNLYKALNLQTSFFGMGPLEVGEVDDYIEDDRRYDLSDSLKNVLRSIHTPGHTEGSCCFFAEMSDGPILFSGDTLFQGSIGRTDLPGGDHPQILKSIKQRLYALPDETRVVTGHGGETQIYHEKKTNPFVQG